MARYQNGTDARSLCDGLARSRGGRESLFLYIAQYGRKLGSFWRLHVVRGS